MLIALMASLSVCAQWSSGDSLKLRGILNKPGEIKLNKSTVKQIDFGSISNNPITPDNPALKYDETLPGTEVKNALNISLMPYTGKTKFNYDPIQRNSIKVGSETWRQRPVYVVFRNTIPANWAKNWMDGTVRRSREEIEAAGVKQVMGVERRNNMYVTSYAISPLNGNSISLGGGKSMTNTGSGSVVGGLDLMSVFTLDFWDKAGRRREERTLEVLRNYGDSTTVLYNKEIITPFIR